MRYGYGSTEAFGRAFVAVHGVTPAQVRSGGVELVKRGLDPSVHERLMALSDQEPDGILAVTTVDDPASEGGSPVDYWHGVATSQPVPDDLDALAVPAWTWAVFSVSGPFPQAIQQLWADSDAQWFPSNHYRAIHGPALLRTRPNADWSEADCELWLPVEPAPAG